QILELILKRVECVEKVGELKGKNNFRIYVPERENSIFKNLYEVAGKTSKKEKISRGDIENIFTEIISFCRSKERKLKVCTEDYNCFFIAQKIFGSCIDTGFYDNRKRPEDYDFKIIKFCEERYSEIFSEEIFKFIVSTIDFSGESYIILGKDSNGKGEASHTGVLIFYPEEGKYQFEEIRGFLDSEEIEKKIETFISSPNIKIKVLGSYEKRKIDV
ncbi:MAG: chorismate mutase, partial [Fusobacteriaceae bacterium]